MGRRITRKEVIQLLVVVLLGWGVAQLLRMNALLGRDMAGNPRALAMLDDTVSPSRNVAAPTLTVVVFTDYQCPACRLASPALDAALTQDGHVRVVYRDWPIFGSRSERAARVAIASAFQGIYPAVHRRLMDERRQLDEPVLREVVASAGGDWGRLQRDLEANRRQIDRQLTRNGADAASIGIAGTPAYLIGPILVSGALDADGFRRAFSQARSKLR